MSISDIIAVTQTIIIAASFVIVIIQTRSTQDSVMELKREIGLTTVLGLHSQLNELNKLMLDDSELAAEVGYSKLEVFAFMILNVFSDRFYLNSKGILDASTWNSELQVIEEVAKLPFVQRIWQQHKNQYRSAFVNFFDLIVSRYTGVT